MTERPKVGVGVIIIKDDKVLLGKRKGALGQCTWCFPGGHLEYGESWQECAKRETMEETGINIKNIRFASTTNDIFQSEGKHYITIFMVSDFDSGEVKVMEPEKCEGWEWFEWDQLPEPLFLAVKNLLEIGFNPFDEK
ncbi:MAG TPA: NUDIX hydrolase [Candidatus Bipolaricaulota bacterium]|nr:NUDIX hydrolase [Candidatus Bipolaricaulota bacterium]